MIQENIDISQRRACRLLGLSRSTLNYQPEKQLDDQALQARLSELATERRRFGYRRLHILLRREGIEVNHKRVTGSIMRLVWQYGGASGVKVLLLSASLCCCQKQPIRSGRWIL